MTKTELRALYLLRKHGGTAKLMQLSQAMARIARPDRERALANLEALELISSAKRPPATGKGAGGTGGLVYWLTDAGNEAVDYLIEQGELRDPASEKRRAGGRPKAST